VSIKARVRKLREQIQEATAAQQHTQGDVWLRSLSDEDLLRLVERQKARRHETGDPERLLTLEEMAATLGKGRETLEAEIQAAGGGRAR